MRAVFLLDRQTPPFVTRCTDRPLGSAFRSAVRCRTRSRGDQSLARVHRQPRFLSAKALSLDRNPHACGLQGVALGTQPVHSSSDPPARHRAGGKGREAGRGGSSGTGPAAHRSPGCGTGAVRARSGRDHRRSGIDLGRKSSVLSQFTMPHRSGLRRHEAVAGGSRCLIRMEYTRIPVPVSAPGVMGGHCGGDTCPRPPRQTTSRVLSYSRS